MEFELSYEGLADDAFKEMAVDVLALQKPRRFMKPGYGALRARYFLCMALMILVLVALVGSLTFLRGFLPTWGRYAIMAAAVAAYALSAYNVRPFITARSVFKAYKKLLAGRQPNLIKLDSEGIHIDRPDGQKRIFLGWSTLTAGVQSKRFVVLCQGEQMIWAVPKSCLKGRIPEFRAMLEQHYYSRGLELAEKNS